MATHDYVIDNQSAPSFRSDLNNVLQAIVTQNSSSTAPTTTYADMIWYDTANNQIKKRNEANSGWITLGTVDEGAGTFTPSGLPSTESVVLLGTVNTTSGSTQTLSGLNLTGYKQVQAWINGVDPSTTATSATITVGGMLLLPSGLTTNLVVNGYMLFDLGIGRGYAVNSLTDGQVASTHTLTTSSTSISVSTTQTFAAGSVTFYGVK